LCAKRLNEITIRIRTESLTIKNENGFGRCGSGGSELEGEEMDGLLVGVNFDFDGAAIGVVLTESGG